MTQGRYSFDRIISTLKEVEPSASFELRFRERMDEAVARKYKETFLEKLLRRFAEGAINLRDALLPEPVVLVRVTASFIIVMSIGIHVYSIQPSRPTLVAKEGVVMVQGVKDTALKEIANYYKFKAGDIVMAGKGAQADIALPDKYEIRLKEGSRLKIAKLTTRYSGGQADFQLIEGKILVSVEEAFRGSRFIVDTPSATAVALGTKFAVDASKNEKNLTEVSVIQGKVKVKSRYGPQDILPAKQMVTVSAGQRTEVAFGAVPAPPARLMEREWEGLEELYQIGKKPQVMLLVKNTPDRAMQLLAPCAIVISDEKPREIPKLLEEALSRITDAVKTSDKTKHLESIKMLERIVNEHPNPKYNVQFLLYIGAYYEYLTYHEDAIKSFEKVILNYPDSSLASMAQCAIGIIYEEKLKDRVRGDKAYNIILEKYPNSLEALWAEGKLGIKKVS